MKRALWIFASVACLSFAAALSAQTTPLLRNSVSSQRASMAYDTAFRQGPGALRAFLASFPKGADLHVHLSGAVYAESFIRQAAEDGICVDAVALRFAQPPCTGDLLPATQFTGTMSPAAQALYDKLINSFSMRSFVPTNGWSGHDQFFATFNRYGGLKHEHAAEWVDEIASRAAAQNQQYLEIMQTPPFGHAIQIAHETGWPAAPDFAQLRQKMLDRGLRDEVATDRKHAAELENGRRAIEHCGTPQATEACQVTVRYLYQVLRGNAPEQVFAQTLLGFETVSATLAAHEPGFVGINFVMPEDGYLSMRDYTLQMRMIEYLHSVYPQVHITLHAGELAEGMVPPEGLRFHIRQAVEMGHAERIGHGVDVMSEDNASALLKEMATKHVMVEINLSSNEGILGVKGSAHPFPIYRAAHVPVALSTDDEGVSRIDITHEYVRAALDYKLTYNDLKQLARTGLAHNFLPGEDLWATPDIFFALAPACKGEIAGIASPSAKCQEFLKSSEKAAAEWELESRFRAFETAQ